jgi:hypothetical protein
MCVWWVDPHRVVVLRHLDHGRAQKAPVEGEALAELLPVTNRRTIPQHGIPSRNVIMTQLVNCGPLQQLIFHLTITIYLKLNLRDRDHPMKKKLS